MKLPALRSAPVQRLETPSPEVAAAPFRALGDIGEMVGGKVDEYLEDKQRKEAETEVMRGETDAKNALLSTHEALSSPVQQVNDPVLEGVDYKDSDIVEGADGEFYVPTYKVSEQILAKRQQEIYAEQSQRMTSDMAAQEWEGRWNDMQRKSFEAGFKQTQKGQQTYVLGEALRTYDESMSLGNYAGAKEALFVARKDGGLSEEKYQAQLSSVNKKEETDPIKQHLAQNDKEALQSDLEELRDPENKMALSWNEREALTTEIESEISALSVNEKAAQKAAEWQFTRNTKSLITAINEGENVSTEEIAATKTIADELSQRKDLTDGMRSVLADFYDAWEVRDEIAEFKKQAPITQAEQLQKLNSQEMTAKQVDLVNRFEKIHQGTIKALQEDSMSYVENIGLFTVPPLDWEDLPASLAARRVTFDKTQAQFGTASGYLKAQEAALFAERINRMPADQVVATAAQVYDGLGDDSVFFWEQMKQKNVGAIAVAGQMFSQGNPLGARDVAIGYQLRKEKAIVLQNENSDYKSPVRSELGTAYAYNSTENMYREAAILDAYAAIAWRNGDTEGEVNSDWLDEAIETVTGGVFEINGVKMTSPQRGVTEDQMETWVETMPVEYIRSLGGSPNMGSEQLVEWLANGNLQLIPASANEYVVRQTGTDTYLAGKDGTRMIIPFNDSIQPEKGRWKRKRQR